MKNRNKAVVKDEFGDRWFVTKRGLVTPTDWKKQCYLVSAKAYKEEVQEKLYGRKK